MPDNAAEYTGKAAAAKHRRHIRQPQGMDEARASAYHVPLSATRPFSGQTKPAHNPHAPVAQLDRVLPSEGSTH